MNQPNPMTSPPSGIAGVQGRPTIGAALAAGRKGPKGNPVDKDIFWILNPVRRDAAGIQGGVRDPHPIFASFNEVLDPEGRKTRRNILAQVDAARVSDCFDWARKALVLKSGDRKLTHPAMREVCRGNGGDEPGTALRWDPNNPENIPSVGPAWKGYKEIPCPGNRCPFAQADASGMANCRPWMRLVARFAWPDKRFPNLPFIFESRGWNTVAFFVGFFQAFETHCRAWGFNPQEIPLFGYPFMLQINEEMRPGKKFYVTRPLPVVGDFNDWIRAQQAKRIEPSPERKLLTVSEVEGDYSDLTSGPMGIPG